MRTALVLSGVAVFALGGASLAADVSIEGRNFSGMHIVNIEGFIEDDDARAFDDLTDELGSRVIVVLSGEGGTIQGATEIGRMIRARGFETAVRDGEGCFSACGIAWLAGTRRYAGVGSEIGFHAAYTVRPDGRTEEIGVGNAVVGAFANQLGLSTEAIIFLTSAPPDGFNMLTSGKADVLNIEADFSSVEMLVKPSARNLLADIFGGE